MRLHIADGNVIARDLSIALLWGWLDSVGITPRLNSQQRR